MQIHTNTYFINKDCIYIYIYYLLYNFIYNTMQRHINDVTKMSYIWQQI